MTSATPQKRMVSSVFITLSSPYRATVTPTPLIPTPMPQILGTPVRDMQHSATPLSPTGAHRRPSASSTATQEGVCGGFSLPASPLRAQARPSLLTPAPETRTALIANGSPHPAPSSLGSTGQGKQEYCPKEFFPSPPPPKPLDSEVSDVPVASPPPPPFVMSSPVRPPVDPRHGPSASTGGQVSAAGRRTMETLPPADRNKDAPSAGFLDSSEEEIKPDVCGFCRKTVPLSEPATEALNRTYHSSCFQCRQCHTALAGKMYYSKAGIPLCEDCYQASLEPCWACGEVIKDHVIRALERAYHPPCFVCTTCSQPIGEQRFAQGEVGEVYCLQDYYRKYAPQCSICGELIIPREDGTDSYTVECLGRSFHEDCYRCEVCGMLLSPEPNEHGCHPLEGQILCKPCHLSLIQAAQH
ncbi:filamin-binding LIM protein 1 isoform X1 [Electrophorus electricus]|uniref:LIM zinc-binding domain-containing protein n=1 Tax=Electrophorus electricus TaxID=8005 RepID=A0A4W4HAS7_ELEEL|nr:filamin-binding LIM protein 1 isoform X1 [Electrophorus electricus]XP_026874533.2 filamin-binding LIM protein 1 isoform X1 [Electrophorus electricus]XP_035376018.1 filamin-binding LIM protein 1 isoform X1 [Electrophorus electricus]